MSFLSKKTASLRSGDAVQTFGGIKIFSHFTDPRVMVSHLTGLTWDAITMNFTCGYVETADYRGFVSVNPPPAAP